MLSAEYRGGQQPKGVNGNVFSVGTHGRICCEFVFSE